MKDSFEKNIREVLNDPPQYAFQEELWKGLEERLINEGKNIAGKKGNGFTSFLPLMLLALLFAGSMFHLYRSNQRAVERIQYLEEQSQQTNSIIHIDTIFEKHVQVVYDTIYKKQVIIERSSLDENQIEAIVNDRLAEYLKSEMYFQQLENGLNQSVFNPSSFNFKGNLAQQSGVNSRSYLFSTPNIANNYIWKKNAQGWVYNKRKENKTYQTFAGLTDKGDHPEMANIHRTFPLEQQEIKLKKGVTYFMHKAKPSRYAISLIGGLASALNFSSDSRNFLGKINGEIGFGQKISLVVGVEYLMNNFVWAIDEVNNGSDFPLPKPMNANDELHEIYGNFHYLQIPFGIKYYFKNLGKFQPYLSGGLLAHRGIYSELTYEYHGTSSVYEVKEENIVPKNFVLDDYWASLGVTTALSNKIRLLLEVSSQFELDRPQYRFQNHQFLKYNLGLQYQF